MKHFNKRINAGSRTVQPTQLLGIELARGSRVGRFINLHFWTSSDRSKFISVVIASFVLKTLKFLLQLFAVCIKLVGGLFQRIHALLDIIDLRKYWCQLLVLLLQRF